jgi:hypothetical protein
MSRFGQRIAPWVKAELDAAGALASRDPDAAFRHLERAHILGQDSTALHVRVHWRMLLWALRRHDIREALGQIPRILGAASKTAMGWVPGGNTGGSRVSPFASMPIPEDLGVLIRQAKGDA